MVLKIHFFHSIRVFFFFFFGRKTDCQPSASLTRGDVRDVLFCITETTPTTLPASPPSLSPVDHLHIKECLTPFKSDITHIFCGLNFNIFFLYV